MGEHGPEQEPPRTPDPAAEAARRAGDGAGELLARALDDLGRSVRARLSEGGADDVGSVDWIALFDEVKDRMRTLGMSEHAASVDDFGLDPEALARARPLLDLLAARWWRLEVVGAPPEGPGPVLYVGNRSGLLPWDGLMIADQVAARRGEPERPRFLVADWLVTLPFAQVMLARLGGVRACRENALRLLRTGRSVVAFPEGVKGAAKVFRQRYRLQRFGRGGVVRVALAAGAPLVPVAVVGAEEAHPILFKMTTVARAAGLPFLPVTPTFPWLGPLGAVPLPSKWVIRFGEPLETAGLTPDAADDDLLVSRLTEELRSAVQAMVDAERRRRPGVFA
jgi:1-acyl-sn-glycerol-3-phosphate acyltransferase